MLSTEWWPFCQALNKFTVHNRALNSLAPGRFQWNFVWIIFKLISVIGGRDIASEIVLRWISLDLSDDKSTLVQAMAWCHQATSHYLIQCCPRSLSPYGVTRPQWANQCVLHFWSKFGDFTSSLNGDEFNCYHVDNFMIDRHTHTDKTHIDAGNYNTQRTKLASV